MSTSSPLLRLPTEILDEILSSLAEPHDLLALALASRSCARLVIPQHIEYRTIRIRTPMPAMWAHLARRKDLTRNVRELRFCARGDYTAPDRCPSTLVEPLRPEAERDEQMRMRNVCVAVGYMRDLDTFVWEYEPDVKAGLRLNRAFEEAVVGSVVRRARGLRRLALGGECAAHVRDGRGVYRGMYPLWEVSGLESLSLLGAAWVDKSNAQHIIRMLQRSPDIEFLEVPTELRGLSTCRFPRLKRLKLSMVSGAVTPTTTTAPNTLTSSQPTDSPLTAFLEAHPTIEELNWSPLGALTLAPGALPALKRLKGPRQIMHALEDPASSSVPASPPPSQPKDELEPESESEGGSMRRPIEALDIWGLAASRLATSRTLDPSALRSLRLEHVGPLESIYALAARFTGITWLSMPAHHLTLGDMYPALIRLTDWLDLLPRFPLLEVFRGPGIWESVGGGGSAGANDRMHGAILELVARCPRLRRLDHWQVYEKRRGVKVVQIYREGGGGGDGERVWYEVGKPSPRDLFDAMAGTFD